MNSEQCRKMLRAHTLARIKVGKIDDDLEFALNFYIERSDEEMIKAINDRINVVEGALRG